MSAGAPDSRTIQVWPAMSTEHSIHPLTQLSALVPRSALDAENCAAQCAVAASRGSSALDADADAGSERRLSRESRAARGLLRAQRSAGSRRSSVDCYPPRVLENSRQGAMRGGGAV